VKLTPKIRFLALAIGLALTFTTRADEVSPVEARAIAREAYIYGFPIVDNYRVEHAYFVDRQDPEFKAPWNQITNIPRVFTPADTAVQTPNSDTPYSWMGLDLRAEPIVLTLPPMDRKDRYFSVQFTDAYTFNFDYLGTRTTGNDGGSFLVAGPNWKGEMPKGVKKVLRSETELIIVVYRIDADGRKLSGANRYSIRFAPGQFPPVNPSGRSRCMSFRRACSWRTRSTATSLTRRCCPSSKRMPMAD
jgi:hypothetical protein